MCACVYACVHMCVRVCTCTLRFGKNSPFPSMTHNLHCCLVSLMSVASPPIFLTAPAGLDRPATGANASAFLEELGEPDCALCS